MGIKGFISGKKIDAADIIIRLKIIITTVRLPFLVNWAAKAVIIAKKTIGTKAETYAVKLEGSFIRQELIFPPIKLAISETTKVPIKRISILTPIAIILER